MKQLTRSEEQIMLALWQSGPMFLRELLEILPPPKPHQNTVATILKILIEKGFVTANVYGRQHQYVASVSKEDYSKKSISKMVKGYFEGSFSNVVSFMVKENNLSVEELESLLQKIKDQQKSQK